MADRFGDGRIGSGTRTRQIDTDNLAHTTWTRREHDHAIGEHDRLFHVVGNEQDGHALHCMNAQQLVVHLRAHLRVELREWFVHQQDARTGDEAPCERDTAAHAAG